MFAVVLVIFWQLFSVVSGLPSGRYCLFFGCFRWLAVVFSVAFFHTRVPVIGCCRMDGHVTVFRRDALAESSDSLSRRGL